MTSYYCDACEANHMEPCYKKKITTPLSEEVEQPWRLDDDFTRVYYEEDVRSSVQELKRLLRMSRVKDAWGYDATESMDWEGLMREIDKIFGDELAGDGE